MNKEVYEKLVSVIIPVYNTEKKFILECLDSIANQSLDKKDIEIIIVDDCSKSQETIKIVNNLSLKDNYKGISLKIIKHEKNKWVAQARITGAKNSKGEYLVFLDSDDLIKLQHLHESKQDHDLLVEIRVYQEVMKNTIDDHEKRIRILNKAMWVLSLSLVGTGAGGGITKLIGLW